jgi:hypothetical protein
VMPPVRHVFAALSVEAENAAYDAVAMTAPLATTASGTAIQAAMRLREAEMCMTILCRVWSAGDPQ